MLCLWEKIKAKTKEICSWWIFNLSCGFFYYRQDTHRMEVDPRRHELRRASEASSRALSLRQRRCPLIRRQLRSVRLMGQDPASVGSGRGTHDEEVWRSYQGVIYGPQRHHGNNILNIKCRHFCRVAFENMKLKLFCLLFFFIIWKNWIVASA